MSPAANSTREVEPFEPCATLPGEAPRTSTATSTLLSVMGAVFFFSGLSSLIYEVVWMRRLALFFGSDIYSAALTLGAFMGGLTLGSLLAARYVDRLRNLLVWYGTLEVAIGIYAFFFPTLLNVFSGQYRHIYQAFFETAPWRYNGFRILVASVTLLIPTTLMGATLPLVVKRFAQRGKVGRYSGFFYSVNTLGALTGVLLVGFVLLPNLGVERSTWTACAINLLIGTGAILLGLTMRNNAPETYADEADANATTNLAASGYDRSLRTTALIAIALSGMAALALEVVWMRILTQSFSGAVYSFSIMLSCFLFGIFYGSRIVSRFVDNRYQPLRLFASLELMIAVSVSLLAVLCHFVPRVFSLLLWSLASVSHGRFALASTLAEFVVSAVLIAVPTLLLGATFPVAVKLATPHVDAIGRGTAAVYAANTAGAVTGALLCGLVLIPAFGSRVTLLLVATLFAITGVFLFSRLGGWKSTQQGEAWLLLGLFAIFTVIAALLPKQVVLNYVYAGNEEGAVALYQGEGIANTVDIVRTGQNVTLMMVNGTMEADTTYAQRRHFILKADLPLLLHPAPHDVAVVGLGLGITLSATARFPGVDEVQVIELSPEMVKAHAHLADVSDNVLANPRVKVRIDDGRNFLAMSDRQFDMITADPIHPRVSGVGYLYTREYYEALKRRLKPDGVVCQWMPMYRISKPSFDVAFRTFASVFPNASFWYVRGHGLFVATQNDFAIDFPDLQRRIDDPVVKADLASIDIHGPDDFLSYIMMGPKEIRAYLAANPSLTLNTDDNAYLEYHTPFEFLESTRTIIDGLLPYARLDMNLIHGLPEGDRERLMERWSQRKAQLVPELSKDE